ncbi:hypothetical protein THF1D04_10161 [Vibrio owensii]|uniref:Uncharacterized protein n=1 Tax=Vibrio owensii TaxID=696485 RepID=A0AAU9PZI0_9VIBR|nr:hypothetical protein THF1D04_10161 [Vibrio owensii]
MNCISNFIRLLFDKLGGELNNKTKVSIHVQQPFHQAEDSSPAVFDDCITDGKFSIECSHHVETNRA